MNTKSSIIVLIVVVLLGGLIYVYGKGDMGSLSTGGGKSSTTLPVNSKSSLMKRIATVDTKPLTEEEKIAIFQSLSAENSAKYGFTPQEKAKVIEALNK